MNQVNETPDVATTEPVRMLTRDLILSALDLPTTEVHVPEWGGYVHVRALTGAERDTFEASMMTSGNPTAEKRAQQFGNVRARMCAMAIVDMEGNRMFSHKDVEALGKKNAAALNRVFEAVRTLSGFSNADVKEIEGN